MKPVIHGDGKRKRKREGTAKPWSVELLFK